MPQLQTLMNEQSFVFENSLEDFAEKMCALNELLCYEIHVLLWLGLTYEQGDYINIYVCYNLSRRNAS